MILLQAKACTKHSCMMKNFWCVIVVELVKSLFASYAIHMFLALFTQKSATGCSRLYSVLSNTVYQRPVLVFFSYPRLSLPDVVGWGFATIILYAFTVSNTQATCFACYAHWFYLMKNINLKVSHCTDLSAVLSRPPSKFQVFSVVVCSLSNSNVVLYVNFKF